MGSLYVDRAGCELRLHGRVLTIHIPDVPTRSVPLGLLSRVVLRRDTRLSSGLLTRLAAEGVGVTMLGGRRGERMAMLLGAPHADVQRRIAQIQRLDDDVFERAWCARVLRAKCAAQRRLLVRAARSRPDIRRPLRRGIESLADCLRVLGHDDTIDAMRGREGAAAAAYFRAFGCLFAPSLGFAGRRRRPPTDPVNACLSLGYTLLYGRTVEACHGAGLDPMLGYLHRPAHGRASLACDLMEPWRAHVDALVLKLFAGGDLRADHFGHDGAHACLLGKTGRARFYAAFAGLDDALDRHLRHTLRLAVKGMRGDT